MDALLWWYHRKFLHHSWEEFVNGPTPPHVICECEQIWWF